MGIQIADKKCLFFLLLMLLGLFNLDVTKAQTIASKTINEDTLQKRQEKRISGLIGLGGYSNSRFFNLDLSFHSTQHIYALRYIYLTDSKIGVDYSNRSEPYEQISELGIYYARELGLNRIKASIGTGLSFVQGIKRGEFLYTKHTFFNNIHHFEAIRFNTLGLILDGKINVLFGKYFYISCNGVVDLNLHRNFYGIGIGLGLNIPVYNYE
jgi:hypothetical protein